MRDAVLESFLVQQEQQGRALAAASDLFDLRPLGPPPVQRYHARFTCKGLVRGTDGNIVPASCFDVLIQFPPDYLRRVEMMEVVRWLGPANVHHPNISMPTQVAPGIQAQIICIGQMYPGTPLVDILYQTFEVITYNRVTMREDDALNPQACAWARRHRHLFPVDRRPLKRPACAAGATSSASSGSAPGGGR